jgi:seryl-tRNA synthetase
LALEQQVRNLQQEQESLRSQKAVAGRQLTGRLQRQHDDLMNLQRLTKEVEQAHATIHTLQVQLHGQAITTDVQTAPDVRMPWLWLPQDCCLLFCMHLRPRTVSRQYLYL